MYINKLSDIDKRRIELIGEDWFYRYPELFRSDLFNSISMILGNEYQNYTIYPDFQDIFKAFKLTRIDNLKCVIIGEDPYYNGLANGLAFGYKDGIKPSSRKNSLEIIFEEMEEDIQFGLYLNPDYSLEYLAKQGVLLLNTKLTVRKDQPNSHNNIGWQQLIGEILKKLFLIVENLVFMCWGTESLSLLRSYKSHYDENRHLVLTAIHPTADIHNSDKFGIITPNYPNTFRGCKHFSQCNEWLKDKKILPVNW